MPFSSNFFYVLTTVIAFTVSYTMIFIALYSRMSDIMGESKTAITGAIATFRDLRLHDRSTERGHINGIYQYQKHFFRNRRSLCTLNTSRSSAT